MMPICPRCGEEIEKLNRYSKWERKCEVFLDEERTHLDEIEKDVFDCEEEDDYECPECSELLTEDKNEAIKFLKGEIDLKKKEESEDESKR